jgi:FlaA1/EpsC-like NDP-sugar epimerase
MPQALQPDDLLPRRPVTFDREQIGEKVRGRRVLVTGGGGSIGSDRAPGGGAVAQPAGAADNNENELHLLYRHLQARHPGWPHAEATSATRAALSCSGAIAPGRLPRRRPQTRR